MYETSSSGAVFDAENVPAIYFSLRLETRLLQALKSCRPKAKDLTSTL